MCKAIMLSVIVLFASCTPRAQSQVDPQSQGEVQLSIARFGVGGVAREGEWVGIQVQMLDQGSSGRDIVLRLSVRDIDGDESQYDRVVTANPGALQSFWLYAWIPFRGSDRDYELKAYEAIDTGNAEVGQFGFRVGRLVGQLPIYNPRIDPPSIAMMGIVGNAQMSLDQYGLTLNGRPAMLFGHELNRTVAGLGIDTLPDRWQGLVGLDTLVWSESTSADTSPARLTPEKARAIQTWIERGGHLVVVLPSSGDPWFGGAHPLRSVLPAIATPTRLEGEDLNQYRSLLTESIQTVLPDNAVVYSFEPLKSQPTTDATPILNSPNGECVVVRRQLGAGMVTVIGLPLHHGQLRRVGLPDPESFWHRVLGLRGEVSRLDQLTDQEKSDASNRSALVFDEGISDSIAKTGRAVQGVLFGIVVFILYWLIAGPGGFAILKAKKKQQHAWVAFIITTAGFTALAWMGATAMRPKSSNISHLSILQQVHGQDTQRTRTWMSVMLPSYGSAVVSLRDPSQTTSFGNDESTNLLAPWTSPDSLSTLTKGFPDNSGYRIESKNPSAIRVPTRATVKTFLADWSGPESWEMPTPVGEPGSLQSPSLTITGSVVQGKIVHDLPGAMTDVRVFVNAREVPILQAGQSLRSRMISQTLVYAPDFGQGGWEPGQAIDLEQVTRVGTGQQAQINRDYFTSAVRFGVDQSGIDRSRGALIDRLIAGLFISQLEPPRFGSASNDPVGSRLALRRSLHGWDLGKWMTQPSVIVIGVIDVDASKPNPNGMPTPVWINDRKVPSSGKTLVVWVYPLESNPPIFLGGAAEVSQPTMINPDDDATSQDSSTNTDD